MAISARLAERLSAGVKRFQPILASAKTRDVNESDTSMVVTDILAEVFGYDKYSEITRELCIKGTYCDLATRIDGKFQMIIEVKAIGLELKEAHIKQAVDYAANQGIEWVALTNGNIWKVFRVLFTKPIAAEPVLDIDLLSISPKNGDHLESLYLLTRESMLKSGLYAYHDHLQAMDKFYLAAVVLSDAVVETVRRELRRLSDVKLEVDELREALRLEVIKREVLEGEKADSAKRKVAKAASKALRSRSTADNLEDAPAGPSVTDAASPDSKVGS
ncbi:MAG: type I restriction enzyme HsdR N-terminal domain-containing protein [Acidobacteria bacterium]|nr:type I restriction enzyme HsdR N-terminal domain-containing protein [Acidobacteriota bacterium]MBI3658753.1 type I restriction enzyme HsdR N-terminal domain-containing protein [Acidobacteriota bacterium]